MSLRTIPEFKEGTYRAKASGTLPNGKPVVVNSDGTVEVVEGVAQELGSLTVFESNAVEYVSCVFDSNSNKVIIVYRDAVNSDYGEAIVGTVSGTSISFGSATVFESANTQIISATFDSSNNKVVIAYKDFGNSAYGTAIVGTVSGTSISFGTATVFESATVNVTSTTFDSSNNKVVIAYRDDGNSERGTAIVGTVSGTSISFGSPVVFETGGVNYLNAVFDDSSNKVVVAYMDSGNSNYGTAVVGTVSGTSISFGTPVVFQATQSTTFISSAFDNFNNKIVIAYRHSDNGNIGTAIVGTVSDTSISFGTAVVFSSDVVGVSASVFDSNVNKIVVAYRNTSPNSGEFVVGTVSGTSISFGSPVVFESDTPAWISTTFDSSENKVVVGYQDSGNSNAGTSVVLQPGSTNLTSENYIGLSEGAIAVTGRSEVVGTPVVFENADTRFPAATFDSNSNKVVVAYRDQGNSEYGTAIVGTVSGTSISFGTPVVFESAAVSYMSADGAVFDSSNNKVVICYRDEGNSNYGTAIVGTVSGTSISFGTAAVFESAGSNFISATFDSTNNKVVVAYEDEGNLEYGTAIVGTVSGTSISFGTAAVFNSGEVGHVSTAFDSANGKVVIAYEDRGSSNNQAVVIGTVSGTSISFGSETVFDSSTGTKNGKGLTVAYDANAGKVVVAYTDVAESDFGKAVVGTVSGTSISFGTVATFESATTTEFDSVYDSDSQCVIIAYKDEGNSSGGTSVAAFISGTDLTFSSPTVFEEDRTDEVTLAFDSSNNKIVAAYQNAIDSNDGTATVFSPSTVNITRGEVANGSSTVTSIVGTVSTNQTGLTPGQQYYVQTDGTLDTTADDPSVLAGTAVTSTSLLVKL